MIQQNNSVTSAGTKDDSSNTVEQHSSSPNNAKPYVARSFCLKESNRKIFWYYFPGYVILYSCLFCLLVLVLAYLYLLLSILNIVEI